MTDKKQINLRLDDKIIEKLEKEAIKQKRSRNNLIELIIEEYFKKH